MEEFVSTRDLRKLSGVEGRGRLEKTKRERLKLGFDDGDDRAIKRASGRARVITIIHSMFADH
jgi:hypothetical protein